ncbi:hypothetical protein IQ06DRAFT_342494 [Phaeosphaeriaceae sp. SRC1lsM3a]|nr:hypothetical protein IQ06DRAFT_342494 [Stagonospora sp. SRC1lsM3a]
MSSSTDISLESKLMLALKPHKTKLSTSGISDLAHKIAFLVRRKYGPEVTASQLSVLFHDRCAHNPEGAAILKCVNIHVHRTIGEDGVDHFIHVRGIVEDDLVLDLSKEVDYLCFSSNRALHDDQSQEHNPSFLKRLGVIFWKIRIS